ncbi:MAG: hypothetical protein KKF12_22370 [Proteobacteria bacterium]|nr:hypothetical protein [Desulfobacula sp.]MBU4133574.1 hypothetical protein [Pseudomonadota bacterium]
MKRMKQFISIGLVCLAGVFLVTACGKKGPPLPPVKDGNILAAPEDLTSSLAGNQVTLAWTHASDPVAAKLEPEAFEVFMATKTKDGCEGCPFVFKSIGTVSLPAMFYQHTLEPGFYYYFRIQALGKNEVRSGYSKTLYLDFE